MGEITVAKVQFNYEQDTVISEVSLTIPEGDFTVIVGPNGAGKTTFLRLIAGLLKPASGQITIDGYSVSEAQQKGLLHLVPQIYNKNAAQFPATCGEIVELGFVFAVWAARNGRPKLMKPWLKWGWLNLPIAASVI